MNMAGLSRSMNSQADKRKTFTGLDGRMQTDFLITCLPCRISTFTGKCLTTSRMNLAHTFHDGFAPPLTI
jgi:hypothetical protein